MQVLIAEQTERSAVVQLLHTEWAIVAAALPASEWSLSRRIVSQLDVASPTPKRIRLSTAELGIIRDIINAMTQPVAEMHRPLEASWAVLDEHVTISAQAETRLYWSHPSWVSPTPINATLTAYINGASVMSVDATLVETTLVATIVPVVEALVSTPWRTWSYDVRYGETILVSGPMTVTA